MKHCTIVSAAIAALAGIALAVPPVPAPPQSSGPDVVVSGIGSGSGSSPFGDASGFGVTKNGSVGSITAFSAGTVSCNIGNSRAIWIDTGAQPNRHPVIGTQLYRLRNVNGANQLDILGLGWLKHGFCALDAQNCHSLTSPVGSGAFADGDCDWLQPFSTDTYSASLNGQQSNLGPRSEVNPWTGAYPFPYILAAQQSGDAIFKRIQIQNSDLVAGSGYVMEVFYIQTDEPTANRYNNYSYRLATVVGSGSAANINLSGPTQATQTVIDAWVAMESGVTKVSIDPSGTADGRLTLGYKVTQTGPTTWHYEYVLHNMNNDAGVRSFSIPIDANVALSNIGFRDVAYHSGEPYSGTDWTFAAGGGSGGWATQTFAQNPNANALRWSTAYSFRFDANVPPNPGTLNLGMFKTGTLISVNNIQVPAVPPPPVPGPFNLNAPTAGQVVAGLTPTFVWSDASGARNYSIVVSNDSHLEPVLASASDLETLSWSIPGGILSYNTEYYWGVVAHNNDGDTTSTPVSRNFFTPPAPCVGDINGDGSTNTADLTVMLGNFGAGVTPNTGGDFDGDGIVTTSDLTIFLGNFGCTP